MIDRFRGQYSFLSNFFICEIKFDSEFQKDLIAVSVEHAYQSMKATNFDDQFYVLSAFTTKDAKYRGNYINCRKDWELIKIDIMYYLLKIKFSIPYLKARLLMTKDHELVEGNWWGDKFWGTCNGIGENNLGKLLMKIRSEVQ